jgi:macrophage erythroblast attacher
MHRITLRQSTLEIELRLQEFIELARGRKAKEALAYFQKHLASWQDTHIEQLQQAATLLAFSPSTSCAPYKVRLP